MRRSVVIFGLLWSASVARGDDWQVKRGGNDPRAQAQLEAALERAPDDAKLLAKLDATAAHAALDQKWAAKLAAHPRATIALIAGELLARHGKLDDAAARLHDAVGLAHDDGELRARAHLALAKLDLSRNQSNAAHDEGEHALADATAQTPLRHAVLLLLAGQAGQPFNRPLPEALTRTRALFAELLTDAPHDAALHKQAGDALAALGGPADGAAEWQAAAQLERNPLDRISDERRAGELLVEAGQLDAALAVDERALAGLPRGHVLRRALYDGIIAIQRRRDALIEQAATWDAAWPAATREFVEWETLARVFDEIGRPERAIAAYTSALARDPHAIEPRRRLIALLERAGHVDDALVQWRRLVESAPGEPRYQLDLAERLVHAGQTDAAERILARVGAASSSTAIHAQLSDLYEKMGRHDRAIAESEKLVKLDPTDGSRLVTLGELYLQKGQRERALTTWKRLADGGPAGLVRLGDVYTEHDMPGEALDLYQRAAAARPDDRLLRAKLADAWARAERVGEAEAAYLSLIDDDAAHDDRPAAAHARQRLIALLRSGDGKRLALRVSPYVKRWRAASDERQRLQRGLLVVDLDRALDQLDAASDHLALLARESKTPLARADVLVTRADVDRARHHLDEAIAALDQAALLDPTRARALAGQEAELLLARYRDKDALVYVQKAAQAAPDDPEAAVRLGDVYLRRNELEAARTSYQQALALDAQRWRLCFTVAQIDLSLGHYDEAAQLYRRVIRGTSDEDQVVEAVRLDLDIEEYLGTLDALEHELWPRSYAHPETTAYVDLLIDLYRRQGGPLLAAARAGDDHARKQLARMGGHALAPLLSALTGGDPAGGASATIATAQLLGELGNPAAAPPLLHIAGASDENQSKNKKTTKGDKDISAAPFALRMAAALGGAMLTTPADRPLLLQLLRSPEKYLRAAALWGLGRLPAPSGLDPLVTALDDDDEPAAVACIALGGRAPSTNSVAALLARVTDRHAPTLVRRACALGLGLVPNRARADAEPALLTLLTSEAQSPVGAALAWTLSHEPSAAVRRALLQALFSGSSEVRRAVLAGATAAPVPEIALTSDAGEALAIDQWLRQIAHASDAHAPWTSEWPAAATTLAPAVGALLAPDQSRAVLLRTLDDLDARSDGMALGPLTESAALTPDARAALAAIARQIEPALTRLARSNDVTLATHARSILDKAHRAQLPTKIDAPPGLS